MLRQLGSRAGIVVVVLTLGAGAGCARRGKSEDTTAARVEKTRGEMRESDRIRATVERVDASARMVQLKDEQGHRFAVEAGEAALARVKPGDSIDVRYQESVAFALKEPDAKPQASDTKVRESTEQTGDGEVQFGRQISTTVQILTVAPNGTAVEFRVPDGPVRTVAIDDADSQRKVANLRPGDAVQVTYTEKLALAVDPKDD
ncbi:MAG: hypothetical protein ABW252_19540 [Polyangiales bacterium]